MMAFVGILVELKTPQIVASVASGCMQPSLPLLVETLPCPGERIPDARDPLAVASAARLAFEHGADYVKTYYTGTPAGFRMVVENSPASCLIAGGQRMNTVEITLQVVSGALEAGSSGGVFGRNIWQSKNPGGMVCALQSVILGRNSVAAALQELR